MSDNPDPRFVAVGATARLEEGVAIVARTALGVTAAVAGPVVAGAVAVTPSPVRGFARRLAGRLDAHGRAVASVAAAQGTRLTTDVVARVIETPAFMRVVDDVVGHVQWRVVDTVLPVVLDRLAEEPEQVRRIVQDQSLNLAQELAQTGRARAVNGDEIVDRLFARLLRRQPPRPRTAGLPLPARPAPPADPASREPPAEE